MHQSSLKNFMLFLLLMFNFCLFVVSCGTSNSEEIRPETQTNSTQTVVGVTEVRVLARSESPAPTWIYRQWEETSFSNTNTKFLLTVKNMAESLNEIDLMTDDDFNIEISNLLLLYTIDILKTSGSEITNVVNKNQYYQLLAPLLLRGYNWEIVLEDEYWEYLQEKGNNHTENYFRYFRRYSLDMTSYIEVLIANFDSAKRSMSADRKVLTETIKELVIQNYQFMSGE